MPSNEKLEKIVFVLVAGICSFLLVKTTLDFFGAEEQRSHETSIHEDNIELQKKRINLQKEKLEWDKYQSGYDSTLGRKPGCDGRGNCSGGD